MSFNIAPQEVGEVRRMSRSTRNDSVRTIGLRNDSVVGIIGDPSTLEANQLDQWKPSLRLYLAFMTLAVITMVVALDGTSLSVALPVGSRFLLTLSCPADTCTFRSYHGILEAPPSKPSGPEPPFSCARRSSSQASLASPIYSEGSR